MCCDPAWFLNPHDCHERSRRDHKEVIMSVNSVDDRHSSLSRGISLLEMFSVNRPEISISEMARRSGMPKSTTHRLVGDLIAAGILERGDRGVRLGLRLFELGHLVPSQRTLREIALPYAHSLSEATGLTCNVAVRDGVDIIYVEKITMRNLRVPHSRAGGRLPLHCTALGKAILAHSEHDLIEDVLAGDLPRLSAKTIVEPEPLRRELARVRETGIAFDVEESQIGLFCVAAPVFSSHTRVVGAISVTGATGVSQAQRFGPAVRATAMALSRNLGYVPRQRLTTTAQCETHRTDGAGSHQ